MKETQVNPNVDASLGKDGEGGNHKEFDITRRTYLRRSLMGGVALAGSGTLDFFDTFTTMSVAHAQGSSFSFACPFDRNRKPNMFSYASRRQIGC